jgi:hypothetical protein
MLGCLPGIVLSNLVNDRLSGDAGTYRCRAGVDLRAGSAPRVAAGCAISVVRPCRPAWASAIT